MPRLAVLSCALALLLAACGGGGNEPSPTATLPPATDTPAPTAAPTEAPSDVSIPSTAPATNISLPDGFTAYAVAAGLYRPTSIAIAPDGTVYVSERHGKVYRLGDADGDGVFEQLASWYETQGEITGLLAAPDGSLYVSRTGEVLLVRDTDGAGDSSQAIVSGLPHRRHQNNGLVLGPDGKLYLTNGTTCDDCNEADERSGTILQANPDGSGLRVYAHGLRNPYDLVFDDEGHLWATDNGSDDPCATVDELDLIVDGGDYGWPYAEDGCDPFNDGIAPSASLGLHTASTGIDFYDATQFPEEYRRNLFLTLWGSFFAEPELPPQLMRAVIGHPPGSPPPAVEPFASGFQHPIDVVADRDGTLLVLDYGAGGENDTDGTLYRIVYTG